MDLWLQYSCSFSLDTLKRKAGAWHGIKYIDHSIRARPFPLSF